MFKKSSIFLLAVFFLASCASQTTSSLSENASFSALKGKPSVVLFAGTYCPHCQKEVPEYEQKIWDVYKDKANLWIQVIDKEKFNTKAAQGFNPLLNDYSALAKGETCEYVPSFVLLDKNLETVMTSCGKSKTMDELSEALNKLIQ